LAMLGVIGAAITIAKGRWGLFVLGLITGGVLWLFTAFARAAPGSLWARVWRQRIDGPGRMS
jgi:hypothetical protein